MQDVQALKLDLAKGLWSAYEESLPDTPARVADVILFILNQKGYTIGTR
jgi:hypothetical protein